MTLALLSLISTAIGGYFYYSSSKDYAYRDAYKRADSTIKIAVTRITSKLAEHRKAVGTLAGLTELRTALVKKTPSSTVDANSILDHFNSAMEVDVCYLMDRSGNTIASSNRNDPDSFVGKNYAFRPYFTQAAQGIPSIYMAVGVTSKKRGIYYSYPVYGNSRDDAIGVAVIKAPVEHIDADIKQVDEGPLLLTGPHNVVFASNRDDWLFQVLWEVTGNELKEISESKQFGAGPWDWTGMKRVSADHATDRAGDDYIVHEMKINNCQGWKVVYLWKSKTVSDNFMIPLFRTVGNIIVVLCVVIGLAVLVLYKKASQDITARKKAELHLAKAYGELEDRVKERTSDLETSNKQLKNEISERTRIETEHRKIQEQLLHSQKLEAVGQLAGGVAHEFNNILTAIINNVYLAKMSTEDGGPVRENLDKILKLSNNAAVVARELLAFSRKQLIDPAPLGLNDIVKGTERLLKDFIGEDIEFNIKLSDKSPVIMADRRQMEQVIINLATNARDAMPGGGSLTIETDIREMDEQFIKTHGFGSPGTYALLSVTDRGEGISEEIKQKIFEPFFTTKEVGKGTGLGLSIVYGIITQHNGHIDVHSKPGEGTTFNIYLPEIKASVREEKMLIPTTSAGKQETILIAEDKDEVRHSISSVLQASGYRVIEAEDGKDAVEKFLEHKDNIALLLIDVIMPKMNGKEAYEEIREIRPGIKAIFMSGYTSDIIRIKSILEDDTVFLSKPVLPDKLLAKIREVLD